MSNSTALNMTEGKIFGKIIRFILPLMLTNFLQVLYNAADMVVVGMSSEPDAMGAIGTTSSMVSLFVNIFIGFSVGANVVVAKHIGAKNPDGVTKAVHTSIIASVIFGVLVGALGLLLQKPILLLMGNSGKLLDLAILYVTIYFIGTPFLSITNFISAILRAEGNTKTPLFVMSFTGLLNVFLNLFFVLKLDMSVDGVALATTISNVASALILLICLAKSKGMCRFSFKKLKIDRRSLKSIVQIGLPAGIQSALFSVSNMLIQSSIIKVNNMMTPADYGYQPIVKGNSVVSNIEGFAYVLTNSVYQAAITFTSQNVGAGKYKRVGRVMRNCYLISFVIAVSVSGILFIFRNPLLGIYGVAKSDTLAYDTAITRMLYMYISYFLLGFMEIGSGVLRGLGKSLTSTVISLIGSCVLRVIWIFTVFEAVPSLSSIYVSYPISWAITALTSFIFCLKTKRLYERRKESIAK